MNKCLILHPDGQPIISRGQDKYKQCHLWSKNVNFDELGEGYKSWINPNIHNLVDLQSSQEAQIGINCLIYYLKDEFWEYGKISSHE